MTETYVCSHCQSSVTRQFDIRSIIRTCDDCGENSRFLNEALVESLAALPAEELPEDWDAMPLDEQFKLALKQGLIRMTRQ